MLQILPIFQTAPAAMPGKAAALAYVCLGRFPNITIAAVKMGDANRTPAACTACKSEVVLEFAKAIMPILTGC